MPLDNTAGSEAGGSQAAGSDASGPAEVTDVVRPGQFSLATLLLVTTLLAGCLGLLRFHAGLGVTALVFSVPAVIRTIYLGANEARRGHRLSTYEKVMAFLASVGVMIMASFAGLAALVFTAAFSGPAFGFVGLILWITIGLVVAGWVVWKLGPPRR